MKPLILLIFSAIPTKNGIFRPSRKRGFRHFLKDSLAAEMHKMLTKMLTEMA